MIHIGIDPGAKGGIAVIGECGKVKAFPYSNHTLIEVLKANTGNIGMITVENVHAMPHQGVSSTFTFGKNLGMILGILEAFNVEYMLVNPQTWKKHFNVTADKQTSIGRCKELYPSVNLRPTPRCRKDSDGLAEAILIGLYGMEERYENQQD